MVLLGHTGAGKTNIVLRYVDGEFQEGNRTTIGGFAPFLKYSNASRLLCHVIQQILHLAALSTKLAIVDEADTPTKLEIW